MSDSMKVPPPSTQPPDLAEGKMIIRCRDLGQGHIVPEVSFDPVGKISQGWFDRHQHVFQRAIQRAQVEQRTGVARPAAAGDDV